MRHSPLQPAPLAIALLVAIAATTALPAAAQDKKPDNKEAKTLDTLVVTAQKREEVMQDVPVTVTALSQEQLQDAGVRDIKDLQVLVPGLTVTSTQNEAITTARIRGVGTVGDNVGLESSVGVVIDGVYRPRNSVGFGDLGEMERIEVLKGPQGTLFGKNTSAGVINVVTKRPGFEERGSLELTLGNHDALGVSASYNNAIGENAAFSLYGAKRERDGWMKVHTGAGPRTQGKDYDQDYYTLRGKLLVNPSDTVELLFSADMTERDENCCTAVQLVTGGTSAVIRGLAGADSIAVPANPDALVAYSNRPTTQKMKDGGVSAELNWQTPWAGSTLTSITAYRTWEAINGLDFDFTTADLIYRNADKDQSFSGFKTFTQEFHLTGSSERLDWLVGMFYSNEKLDRNDSYSVGAHYEPYVSTLVGQQVLGAVAQSLAPMKLTVNMANPALFFSQVSGKPFGTNFAGLGALDHYKQQADSFALFTNNTWHATDALDITMGLRYTAEGKKLDSLYSNPNGGVGCGATLANLPARVGAALAQRINGFSSLPAATQQALLASLVPATAPSIAGYMCLPWANVQHNGRKTHQQRDENEWSGTLKAAYRWNPQVMTYASAARGYKAGGFNLDRVQSSNGLSGGGAGITPVNDTSFPGEFVDSYELGAKTTWQGGNLLLNATAFHQTYSNFQLNSFLGTSFVVRSIPEVVSRGVDAELLWQASPGLMLQGGLMYADTVYGDHIPGADFVAPTGQLHKLPGARMSFAPRWSGTAAVTYDWNFSNGWIGRFNIGAKYMSEFNTGSDLDQEKHQDGFAVANARFGFGPASKRWMVEVWGNNIFDQRYIQVAFDGPLQAVGAPVKGDPLNTFNAFPGAPAMYGMTLRINFN